MKNGAVELNKYAKAYGYVRISKDDYGSNKDSLENQELMIRRYAKENGIYLKAVIIDDDISGYKFDTRKGLQLIKAEITSGSCDMVIAKDLSRLGVTVHSP